MAEIQNIKTESDVPHLLAAGAASVEPHEIDAVNPTQPVVIIPKDYRVEYPDMAKVERLLDKPKRKTGRFEFADVDSFIRYFIEHSNDDSRIFADINDDGATYRAVLNFHSPSTPSWNDHECVVQLRATHEWQTWCANNKKEMSQTAFASFLEDNAEMFITPPGAKLLELITTLEGKSHVDFTQGLKLQSGAINLKYSEVVELSGGVNGPKDGQMQVPAMLEVSIAPFEGTPHYTIKARLRFRINSRKLFFFYEAVDPHLVVRTVCADISKNIETKTKQIPFRV